MKADLRRVIGETGSGPLTILNILEEPAGLPQFRAAYEVLREHHARQA